MFKRLNSNVHQNIIANQKTINSIPIAPTPSEHNTSFQKQTIAQHKNLMRPKKNSCNSPLTAFFLVEIN